MISRIRFFPRIIIEPQGLEVREKAAMPKTRSITDFARFFSLNMIDIEKIRKYGISEKRTHDGMEAAVRLSLHSLKH
jgi:hypothetical protein